MLNLIGSTALMRNGSMMVLNTGSFKMSPPLRLRWDPVTLTRSRGGVPNVDATIAASRLLRLSLAQEQGLSVKAHAKE